MADRYLKLLSAADAEALLAFELHNRVWFEQHIPPRETSFYSTRGVKGQIAYFLKEYKAQRMVPMLIMQGEMIIGRINLTEIRLTRGEATLGYRVGEAYTRQGVASFAATEMLKLAANDYGIETCYAIASIANLGSQKVLEKVGFNRCGIITHYAQLHGKPIDCYQYRQRLIND